MAAATPLNHQAMQVETLLSPQQIANEVLRLVWFYFEMPPEYLIRIGYFPDTVFNQTLFFNVAKAVVVNILKNRDAYGMLFQIIFDRSCNLHIDLLHQLKIIVESFTEGKDPCSDFITLSAICADFVLFMKSKMNFLNIDKEKIFEFFIQRYIADFERPIRDWGGMRILSGTAVILAGSYPTRILQDFILKYCKSYDTKIIPSLFQAEIDKYGDLKLIRQSDGRFVWKSMN